MKMVMILALISTLLIGTISAVHQIIPPFVLDTDGNPLVRNSKYVVFPAKRNIGGGPLIFMSPTDEPCPLFLGQQNITKGGLYILEPVQFTPAEDNDDYFIRQHTNFIATFTSSHKPCKEELKWKVEHPEQNRNWRPIAMGKEERFSSFFKLRRSNLDDGYVFYWGASSDWPCDSQVALKFVNGKRMYQVAPEGSCPDDYAFKFQRIRTNANMEM